MCLYHWKWFGGASGKTESVDKPVTEAIKRKKGVNKVSEKRAEELKEYKKEARIFKKQNPNCQLKYSGCTGKTEHVHHTRGKEGKMLLNKKFWKSACPHCHDIATEHSKEAIETGRSVSRHIKGNG
jgi:hypothetical protein